LPSLTLGKAFVEWFLPWTHEKATDSGSAFIFLKRF